MTVKSQMCPCKVFDLFTFTERRTRIQVIVEQINQRIGQLAAEFQLMVTKQSMKMRSCHFRLNHLSKWVNNAG